MVFSSSRHVRDNSNNFLGYPTQTTNRRLVTSMEGPRRLESGQETPEVLPPRILSLGTCMTYAMLCGTDSETVSHGGEGSCLAHPQPRILPIMAMSTSPRLRGLAVRPMPSTRTFRLVPGVTGALSSWWRNSNPSPAAAPCSDRERRPV